MLLQVPMFGGTSQRISGWSHSEVQHTALAQNRPVTHCDASMQEPPTGTGVWVGVWVGVCVAVRLGVAVAVLVTVGVLDGVLVGVDGTQSTMKSLVSATVRAPPG